MRTLQKNVLKYQRCTECDWKGEPLGHVPLYVGRCPKCDGFLILKSTQQSSVRKKKPNPKYQRKVNGTFKDEGYRLHRDPKGKGWSFVEGRSEKSAPVFMSNEDARRINACVLRRGLIRTRKKVENNS